MRAILFDLDGTLLRYERPYRELLDDAVRDTVGEAPAEDLEAYEEAFFERFLAFDPRPAARAFEAVRPAADPAAFAEALLDREIEATAPAAGADEVLARLGERHRLGVLTNGLPQWQRTKLEAHGLDSRFDAVVASYEAGAHKPDPEPFALAEERLPADAHAMVGDSEDDVAGARDAGWATYRYEGGGFEGLPGALGWGD